MNIKRCACVAAAVVAVCTVAFLYGNRPASETKDVVRGTTASAAPVASVASVARESAALALPAAASPSNQTETVRGTKPYVLTCEGRFSRSLRLAAEALGARTVSVLSRKSLLVEADAATVARLRADSRFAVDSEFLPSEKVAPALAAAIAGGAKTVDVTFLTLSSDDRKIVQERIAAHGGEVLKGCLNAGDSFSARLPAGLVAELASCGDVRWMEQFVRPRLMNDKAVDPALMNVRPIWWTTDNLDGLSGTNQVVSTSDSGIDTGDLTTIHADLRNRVKGIDVVSGCTTSDSNGHGTHTAGSIVGDGTMSGGKVRGTAWGADLYSWFCGGADGFIYTPDSYDDLFQHGGDWPAYIHSASWGVKQNGEYTARCAEMDEYLWKHPEFLPVYSAGNEGDKGVGTIGDPAAAKNVLTVGATQSSRSDHDGGWGNGDPTATAKFSSRGPCQDGRIKPDISAPGVGILSTRSYEANYDTYGVDSNTNYAYDSGTSMSCPLTAGAVALVREWLMRRTGEFADADGKRPTAALMKAVITGGAKGAATPGNDQGWGRVDLAETLFPSNRAVKLIDRIPFADGDELAWIVETKKAAPFDVQLAWVDAPGSAANQSVPQLVNDLDLSVCPLDGGNLQYGNGGNKPDTLNNLESVRIATAPKGRYLVTVTGSHVTFDHTEGGAAALYIRGAFDPDEVVEHYTVRIVKSPAVTNTFARLDRALEAATSGDVIEILEETELRESVVLTNGCALTVVSTNANPRATPIVRRQGADILVKNGSVFFTNVAFRTESSVPVKASEKGVVKVAGTAVFDDIVSGTSGVLTDRPAGFVLAGALENGITVGCSGASSAWDPFGTYSCDYAVASNSARRLVSANGVRRAGVAERGTGLLKWEDDAPVDPAVAVAYVDGDAPTYFRTLDDLFDRSSGACDVVVTKSNLQLTKPRAFSGVRSMSAAKGAGEVVIVPASSAGFTLGDGCELTVSGITFRDYAGNGLFVVNGAGAKLTVTNSVFSNIEGTNKWSGAITVLKGRAFVCDSVFDKCHATGQYLKNKQLSKSYGGAVYLAEGCGLELNGGSIENCTAGTSGGGVYAAGGAVVSVRGALTVKGNSAGIKPCDDIFLANEKASLVLSGKLEGEDAVGIRYASSSKEVGGKGIQVGNVFAAVGVGVDRTTAVSSAKAFFNDGYPETTRAEVDGSDTKLLWVERTAGDRFVDPSDPDATVRVTKGGETHYYVEPEYAFGWIGANETATVEILKGVDFGADLVVTNGAKVTVTSTNAAPYTLSRFRDVHICVLPEASLTVTNLTIDGNSALESSGLIKVNGGSIDLQAGALVYGVRGKADRASGAISVQDRGTFTLRSGAAIFDCVNEYVNLGSKSGYGGGVLVEDHSKACLFGGSIEDCRANRGGGMFVGTDSAVFISGDTSICGNRNLSLSYEEDNLCVADKSQLQVDGKLTGTSAIGYNEGRSGDQNVFGKVGERFSGTKADLQAAAHRFTHDFTGDVGMAVSDGSETLLVWGNALDADGKYGDGYALLEGALHKVAVPTAKSFPYDGTAKTSVESGIGYLVLSGNVATNVGNYVAVVTTRPGFAWADGKQGQKNLAWSIGAAEYVLKGISFEDREFEYDGTEKRLEITGTLPAGLSVSYANNSRWQPGTNEVTACIYGSVPNYQPDPFVTYLSAKLIIVDTMGRYNGEKDPPRPVPPGPHWEVVTTNPTAIAFKSVERVSDTEWSLVITDRVEFCNYRLLWTTNLVEGFVSTGEWEHAVGPAADPVWRTNVVTTGGTWYWRAEGKDGTNMVLKVEE